MQLSHVLLTHIVEAIGFSSFGTYEGYISPLAIAVGVTFDQVVWRFSVRDPFTQELAYATSMNNTIPKQILNQSFRYYRLALMDFKKKNKAFQRKSKSSRGLSHTASKNMHITFVSYI